MSHVILLFKLESVSEGETVRGGILKIEMVFYVTANL